MTAAVGVPVPSGSSALRFGVPELKSVLDADSCLRLDGLLETVAQLAQSVRYLSVQVQRHESILQDTFYHQGADIAKKCSALLPSCAAVSEASSIPALSEVSGSTDDPSSAVDLSLSCALPSLTSLESVSVLYDEKEQLAQSIPGDHFCACNHSPSSAHLGAQANQFSAVQSAGTALPDTSLECTHDGAFEVASTGAAFGVARRLLSQSLALSNWQCAEESRRVDFGSGCKPRSVSQTDIFLLEGSEHQDQVVCSASDVVPQFFIGDDDDVVSEAESYQIVQLSPSASFVLDDVEVLDAFFLAEQVSEAQLAPEEPGPARLGAALTDEFNKVATSYNQLSAQASELDAELSWRATAKKRYQKYKKHLSALDARNTEAAEMLTQSREEYLLMY